MQEEKNTKKTINKTLMRLQNPIYELKRNDEGQTEFALRKFMKRQQPKPQISAIQRSPLLNQLELMMPMFKKSNEQLQRNPVREGDKIDAKLVECESSESESDEDQMEVQRNNESEMVDEAQEQAEFQKKQEIELNFMKYPMALQKQEARDQKSSKEQKKGKLIQEI